MIVDTSNEIGGDGDIPHQGIRTKCSQDELIEAVENHVPQVIVIDEIGTKLEAMAASTVARVTIENLMMNPYREMLLGGIQILEASVVQAIKRLRMDDVTRSLPQISEAIRAFVGKHADRSKHLESEDTLGSSEKTDASEAIDCTQFIIQTDNVIPEAEPACGATPTLIGHQISLQMKHKLATIEENCRGT
ncbi:hypothetical protein ACLOJK_010367 [Asimina triloba]